MKSSSSAVSDLDLSKIRHELRTPINHILGYCDILIEEELPSTSFRADLLKIHNGGRQLLSLINHYFDEKTFATIKLDAHQLFHELRTPVNHIIGYSELLEEQAPEVGCAGFIPDLQKIKRAAETWLALMEEHLLPVHSSNPEETLSIDPGVGFVTPIPKSSTPPEKQSGSLLVVDDDPANREMLGRRLRKSGYDVILAENGLQAIRLLRAQSFDLVLLDLIMPGLDGYQVLSRLKADSVLKHVPVIMISALDQENGIARCIEMGAEDYIAKPFNPIFLRARIGASLEKKRLRDQEQRIFQALLESQQKLAANLNEAASYVQSLFPKKLQGAIRTDYVFEPSTQLGGDTFGYHFLDEDHLAIYLLDVSGHGVGAALLSVSVMNVIRARTLNVDFRKPGAVLAALNAAFQMENQNNLFFTIWYGVYWLRDHTLVYATGGHPPALLRQPGRATPLCTRGPAIGCVPDYAAREARAAVSSGDQLLIFSDGVYELIKPDGKAVTYHEFEEGIRARTELQIAPALLMEEARQLQQSRTFEDDFSLLSISF